MDSLKIGDSVLTANGFSEIFAFMDHSTSEETEYLNFAVGNKVLRVSKDHIVYAHAEKIPILAHSIIEGDILWHMESTANATSLRPSPVLHISTSFEAGKHAPLTKDSSIIVDGVLVSSYANVKSLTWGATVLFHGHQINKYMHAPLRWMCEISPKHCGPEFHSKNFGRHAWTQWILDNFSWLQALNYQHNDIKASLFDDSSLESVAAAATLLFFAGFLSLSHGVIFAHSPSSALFLCFAALFFVGLRRLRAPKSKTKLA